MNTKIRLRRFWRYNKNFCAMWLVFLQIPAIITPPYNMTTFFFVLAALLWGVVWKLEFTLSFYKRVFNILFYQKKRAVTHQREKDIKNASAFIKRVFLTADDGTKEFICNRLKQAMEEEE